MPVELTIAESVTELETTVVTVILESASTPGPAGVGVPTGGTAGQVLTKDSGTDYDTSWQDSAGGPGGGAPTDVDYLVGTASGDLSAEIVVGTSPGGELGGTWASPTVDATHSGSSHAAVQAAAEATAAAALSSHESDQSNVHGIADTTALALTANHPSNATFNDHSARHENGGADEISLAGLSGTSEALQTHLDDTTDAHDASAVSVDSTSLSGTAITVQGSLEELDNLLDDHSARHENGGADEISLAGLDGTPTELTNHLNDTSAAHAASAISADSTTLVGTGTDVQAVLEELDNAIADHLADTADAHDASTISVLDTNGDYTATDVEGVLAEIAPQLGAGGVPDIQYESRSSNTILGTADKGKVIDITATITQTFEADETLGDGWWVVLRNAGGDTVRVTLDPASGETVDGAAQIVLLPRESRLVLCNGGGANFNSIALHDPRAIYRDAAGDIPPDTAGDLDDEFDDASFSGWAWHNQDTVTATEGRGYLVLNQAAAQNDSQWHAIEKTVSGSFDVSAKLQVLWPLVNFCEVGIFMRDSSDGEILNWGMLISTAGVPTARLAKWTNFSTFSSTALSSTVVFGDSFYLRVVSDATTLTFYWSRDGITWISLGTETISTFIDTVDRVGVGLNVTSTSYPVNVRVDWFRGTS